jgi:hypothetical protein
MLFEQRILEFLIGKLLAYDPQSPIVLLYYKAISFSIFEDGQAAINPLVIIHAYTLPYAPTPPQKFIKFL